MKRAKQRHIYRFKRKRVPRWMDDLIDAAFRRWLHRIAATLPWSSL